jgi:hypothetical protein
MSGRRGLIAVALAATLLAPPAVAVGAPDAPGAPTIVLTFVRSHVAANVPLQLNVVASHLPSGSTLVLQSGPGTKPAYRAVEQVSGKGAPLEAPGLPMGRYTYRVIAKSHNHVVARSLTHVVLSYGTVTAAQLCAKSKSAHFLGTCVQGSIQVGTHVFEFSVVGGEGNKKPNGSPDVEAVNSSCRKVTITYAVSNAEQTVQKVTNFGTSLTQAKAAEQNAATTPGNIGKTTFTIGSVAWDLELWSNTGDDVFWAANFSCWSRHGAI